MSSAKLEPGTTVGFVGLGNMGIPMTGHLVRAGYDVRAYDADAAARARFEGEHGVAAATSLAGAAQGAKAVVLMLPSSPIVRSVLLDEGLLDAVADDGIVIDMGSSEPTETRKLAVEAEARGVQLVDAPVSGGVRGAVQGTLTVMVGGPERQVSACRPLLETLGGNVLRVGPVGAGHALKALNNLLSATTLLASYEALQVGMRFGLDPELMLDAINVSTGRSYSTDYKIPSFVLPRTYTAGFALRLMVKDIHIATALARATDTPLELGHLTADIWERAAAELPEDADHTEIARWLDDEIDRGVSGPASG